MADLNAYEELLTSIKNQFEEMLSAWQDSVISGTKTSATRNFTLDDWNDLLTLLAQTRVFVEALYPVIQEYASLGSLIDADLSSIVAAEASASDSAASAESSAAEAATSASSAAASADAAGTSASSAEASATSAEASSDSAETSAANAESSATNAETSATNAAASAASAESSAGVAEAAAEEISSILTDNEYVPKGYMDVLSSKVTRNDKRITNLEQGLMADAFETDDKMAYMKNVPQNALPYAAVSKIGGMTRRCENLVPYPYVYPNTLTVGGITYTVNSDGTVKVSGTSDGSAYFTLYGGFGYEKTPIPDWLEVGKTYTASSGNSNVRLQVYLYPADGGDGKQLQDIFTVPDGYAYCGIFLWVANGVTASGTCYPMLNRGSIAIPYEPYYADLRDAKVTEIKSYNANLITPRNPATGTINELTYTFNVDGSVSVSGTADKDTYILVSTPKIENGKSYFISGCPSNRGDRTFRMEIQWYDKSGAFKAAYDSGSGAVLPTPDNNYTTAVYIFVPSGTVMDNDIFKPMLNYGSIALPYVKRASVTLPVPQAVQDLPDWGVGYSEGYYNHIVWNPETGVKKYVRNCYRATINGTEKEADVGMWPNTYRFYIRPNFGVEISQDGFSDTYESIAHTDLGVKKGILLGHHTAYVIITDPDFTDLATAKAKLAANPVNICFYSDTVVETDVSDSLTDDNIIRVENGGTVVAENAHQFAVPTEITYQLKEVSV